MIQLGAGAGGLIVDAAGVELERVLRRVDGHGDGSDGGDGGHQRSLIARGNVHEASVLGGLLRGHVDAGVVLRGVGVVHLGLDAHLLDVGEGLVHQTALASVVACS